MSKPLNEIEFVTKIENYLNLRYLSQTNNHKSNVQIEISHNWMDGKMIFGSLFEKFDISAYDVLENIPEGIVLLDTNGTVLYMNQFGEQITGWKQKEAVGKNQSDIFRLFDGNASEIIEHSFKKALESDGVISLPRDTVLLTKNNERIYLSASYAKMQGFDSEIKGIASVFRDVSRLRKKEIEVEENEFKFRTLFNNTTDAVFVVRIEDYNLPDEILEVNDAACKFVNKSREELLKMKITDIVKSFNFEFDNELINRNIIDMNLHGQAKSTKRYNGFFNGSEICIELNSHYFKLNEQDVILSIVHDVTSFKIAERKMQEAQKAAEEANKTKSMFLANMSHEIRTPLNGILGMSDLLLRVEMTSEEQKETTRTIIACSQNLLHLLNNILDFSKIEAEKVGIDNYFFDLRETIEESVKIYKLKANEKGLEIINKIRVGMDECFIGDKIKLQQILNNMINNAIKFTNKGSVIIDVTKQADNDDSCSLLFSVMDTGIGIAEQDIGKLFTAFSQVDGSYTRQFGGTGLGLSISKKLVELMGGQIWVESKKGIGSRFNFILKFKKASSKEFYQRKKQCTISENNDTGLKGKRVLLAEDEKVNQQVFLKIAHLCLLDVTISNNGFEAYEAYTKNAFDLIMMDIQMPIMDGVEATKKIREYEEANGRQHTPIIALTAHALQGEKEKYLKAGMDDYLAKPYSIEELLKIMARKINMKIDARDDIKISQMLFEGVAKSNASSCVERNAAGIKDCCINLKKCILEKDVQGSEKHAHRIKEIASDCGCESVKYAAFAIEIEVRKKNFAEADILYRELISEMEQHLKENE